MSKTIQQILPGFEGMRLGLERDTKCTRVRFYYLRNRKRDKMIAIDKGTGNFIESDHDVLNSVPHLWNNRNQAKSIARKFFGYHVEIYPYDPR